VAASIWPGTSGLAAAHGRWLCASQASWDSVLSVRDGSCTGSELACSDDDCGQQGRVALDLTRGQGIVIIVDSFDDDGRYQLAITPQ
jgi:hypothetical protein